MQLKKPISEYTIAGLLFIGAQTKDAAVKSAVLAELRRRREIAHLRKEATERNRLEREKLNIELEIEGVRSKNEQERRRANRDLFAQMKDLAFETVEVPAGLPPAEAVRQYNRSINARAKELYQDFKQQQKKGEIKRRRKAVEEERAAYREEQAARQKAKQIETETYRKARFPLIGEAAYYTDTKSGTKQIGTIKGFTYRQDICAFLVRIEGDAGQKIKRALSAVEPVSDAGRFNEVKATYMEFEKYERLVKERDALVLRAELFRKRIREIDPVVRDYLQSDFRKKWIAADEVAKAFARSARHASEGTLF